VDGRAFLRVGKGPALRKGCVRECVRAGAAVILVPCRCVWGMPWDAVDCPEAQRTARGDWRYKVHCARRAH
jgi:hypothetical protein